MCIIAYAPAGVQMEDKTIERMFKNNPDGAGIMWKPTPDANVEIRKGFMKVEDLLAAYHQIPTECEKAIHCRIATSGKVSVGCCHPFPVRPKTKAMREAVDSANMALMHNGVFSFATPKKGMKADYSDTLIFAAHYIFPLQKQLDLECMQTLIEEASPSRLLIFRKNADTIMLGNWQCEKGVFYSNGGYKPASLYTYGYYGYGKNSGTKTGAYTTRGCYGFGAESYVEDDFIIPDDPCLQAPKAYVGSAVVPLDVDTEAALKEIEEALFMAGFDVTYDEAYKLKSGFELFFEVDSLTGAKPAKTIAGYSGFEWEE